MSSAKCRSFGIGFDVFICSLFYRSERILCHLKHCKNILEILSFFMPRISDQYALNYSVLRRHFRAFTILSVPNNNDINSSDAGDGIFRLWRSIPYLLMHWPLKSPVHQQACYWLCWTDNMYCCSNVNFIYLGQIKSKIWFTMRIRLWLSFKQFSMLRINVPPILLNIRFSHNSTVSFVW